MATGKGWNGTRMVGGRLIGLVSGAVFKTVERPSKPLVCSIRTAFRHAVND